MDSQILAAPLSEGPFSVGMDKKFKPIGKEDPPEKGALKLSLNPFLIKTPDRNILIDTGLGGFGEGTSCNTLRNYFEQYGLTEYEITDIFISHLHIDHLGGLAEKQHNFWELTMPDASIWVSEGGWNKLMEDEPFGGDPDRSAFAHFIEARGNLQFVESGDEPFEGVHVEVIGGHTEYHLAWFMDFGNGHKFMMAGDVIGSKGAINRNFAAKYDFSPKQSMQVRKELTARAYEEGYTILAYHDTDQPMFRLTEHQPRKGYTIEPVTDHHAAS